MTALDQRSVAPPIDHLTVVSHEQRVIGGGWYAPAAFAADAALALAVVVGTLFLSPSSDLLYVAAAGSLPLLWPAAVALHGGYVARFGESTAVELRRLGVMGARLGVLAALVSYWSGSPLWLHFAAVTLPLLVLLSVVVRLGLRSRLHRMRRAGLAQRRVVAVGGAYEVTGLADRLSTASMHGLRVVGACLSTPGQVDGLLRRGIPSIGGTSAETIERTVELCRADAVIVSQSVGLDEESLRRLIWRLEPSGTSVILAPGIGDVAESRLSVQVADGFGLVHVQHRVLDGVRLRVKGLVDRVLGLVALLLLGPILLAVAVAVRLNSPGPVLFRQVRTGRGGQQFTMIKFRTMVVDAEDKRSALLEQNDGNGVLFKMRQDPRVTSVGRVLRRYSLDELPQIFNVISGDMSLVGPRPPLPAEVELYEKDVHRRFAVKPGMTGLWQVSGRADLGWEDAVRLDLSYVDNWSLSLDAQILWKTCGTVLGGHGAY